MNTISYPISENVEIRREKALSKEKTKISFLWILRGGFIINIILFFLWIMVLNKLSTQGFELAEIKENRFLIQKELEKWDIENAIPVSLYALEASEQVQNMEKTNKKEFIFVKENELAKK